MRLAALHVQRFIAASGVGAGAPTYKLKATPLASSTGRATPTSREDTRADSAIWLVLPRKQAKTRRGAPRTPPGVRPSGRALCERGLSGGPRPSLGLPKRKRSGTGTWAGSG